MKEKKKEVEIQFYPDLDSCVEDDEVNEKLRKSTHTLKITAFGCILLGIWSLIRMVLMFVADKSKIIDLIHIADTAEVIADNSQLLAITYVLLFILVFIFSSLTMLIYLAVGLGAYKQVQGKKMKPWFVILLLIALVMEVLAVWNVATNLEQSMEARGFTIFDEFASVMMSVAFVVLLIDMLVAAIRVQYFRGVLKKNKPVKEVA